MLTPAQRAAALAEAEERLPPEVRETRRAAEAALALRRDEARLRAAGASPAEIHALREQRFGPEAAERLAALDRRRQAWAERLEAWRGERAALLAAGFADAAAQEAAVAAARAQHFQGPERLRVEALERSWPAPGDAAANP